jgi:polysaccharide deacetylase 2 family uncharacterized protein YibQ
LFMAVTARDRNAISVAGGPLGGALGLVLLIVAAGAGAGLAYLIASFEQGESRPMVVLLSDGGHDHTALPPPGDALDAASHNPLTGSGPAGDGVKPLESAAGALPPVPDPALVKVGRNGPLPIIGPDGRRPREVYARPFDMTDTRPRIALVIGGLGLSRSMTEAAIKTLPAAVTFSFSPYGKDLQLLINEARAAGHEVLLEMPMEPFDYPHNDPGPYTLLTQSDVEENLDKLDWLLSRFTGYAGVVSDQGDRLLSAPEDLKPILAALNNRGLYFIDHGNAKRSMVGTLATANGMPWGTSLSTIDKGASRAGIDLRLLQLEEAAREKGAAIGTGEAYPVTIERIKAWADSLDAKGIVIAPISAAIATPAKQPSQ